MATLNKPVSAKTILSGGYQIYVASRFSDTETRVGVFKDDEISFGGDNVTTDYNNYRAQKIKNGDLMNVKFTLAEQRPDVMAIINNGTVTKTSVPNSLETGRVDTFLPGEWGFDSDVLMTRYNADGTPVVITAITVTKAGTATDLVEDDDYTLTTNFLGMSILHFHTGSVLVDADADTATIRITYNALPPAYDLLTHESSGVAVPFVAYLVRNGVDQDGATMSVRTILDDVTNKKGFTNFAGDNSDNTAGLACEFSGRVQSQQWINFD